MRLPRLALGGLILLACLLSASTWRVYSNTWDEPEHLAAGIELLDRGRYEYDTEHPPIARALMALGPYLAGARSYGTPPPDGTLEGVDILYGGGHYSLYLSLARLGALPFLALLLGALWLWARRLFDSTGPALLSVALLIAVPPVLGHAGLATLDVAAAATCVLAFYALQCWISRGGWRDAAFFGLAAGVAFGSKFSAIPFLVLGMGALTAVHLVNMGRGRGRQGEGHPDVGPDRDPDGVGRGFPCAEPPERGVGPRDGRSANLAHAVASSWAGRRLGELVVVVVMASSPLVLAYEFRSTSLSFATQRFAWVPRYLALEPGLSHAAGVVLAHVWLPRWLQGFVEGVVALKAHNDAGHVSFLLGNVSATGWWYFYLVALAVKTPIPLLLTGPVGLMLLALRGWRERNSWLLAAPVLFLTMLGFASAFSRINIGIRHVLVLYPFLVLGAVYTLTLIWRYARASGSRHRAAAGTSAVLVLLGWQLSTMVTANPDYLPYFNEAVSHPADLLVDSDLDWGQDLYRLEQRAAQLHISELSLAYRGTADLSREPLPPHVDLPPWHPVTGWVAISALALVHDARGYAWLRAYSPLEKVGKSIELYHITD